MVNREATDRLNNFIKEYWGYYLNLEKIMLSTEMYVEIDEENFKTFSLRYQQLLESVCGEIDVVGKYIAHELNIDFNPNKRMSIQKWWFEIQGWFGRQSRQMTKYGDIELRPWAHYNVKGCVDKNGRHGYCLCDGGKTPSWWTAYNNVKHNRTQLDQEIKKKNYVKANLENVLYAFAALYLLEKNYIEYMRANGAELEGIYNSRLFEMEPSFARVIGHKLELSMKSFK